MDLHAVYKGKCAKNNLDFKDRKSKALQKLKEKQKQRDLQECNLGMLKGVQEQNLNNLPGKKFHKIDEQIDIIDDQYKGFNLNFWKCEDKQYISFYTDGSALKNGKSGAKAGSGAFFYKDSPLNVSKCITEQDGMKTNNVAEIMAIVFGLEKLIEYNLINQFDGFLVFTDSSFVIDSLCNYLSNWIKNGWKTSRNEPVVNSYQFKKIIEIVEKYNLTIYFKKVKAHSGIEGNEMADKLAKNGALAND